MKDMSDGKFKKEHLWQLISNAAEPYKHTSGSFTTIVDGKHSSCVSVLLLSVVNTVLSDKRKAEELSKIEAKKRRRENKGKVRTPNIQRASCGIVIATKLK